MSAFGDQLKEAREAQGVSLAAVADVTRISARHLAALERNDLDGLPRGPFGKGYIQAYAQFLGIDPEPILEAYRAQERQRGLGTPETQRQTLEEFSQIVGQRSETRSPGLLSAPRTRMALALTAAGILGAAGWLIFARESPSPTSTISPSPAEQRRPEANAAPKPMPGETRAPEKPVGVPAPTMDTPSAGFHVSDSGVGTGIENRRLVGRADRFVEGTLVSFWTRAVGGVPGDVIRHVWIHDGREVMRVDLAIGGSHWRTHSRFTLPEGAIGSWTAEARDPDGRTLAREEFVCVAEEH